MSNKTIANDDKESNFEEQDQNFDEKEQNIEEKIDDTVVEKIKKSPVRRKRISKNKQLDEEIETITSLARLPDIPPVLPIVALKDHVVYNSMIVPLFESREQSINAIDFSQNNHKFIFLTAQKDESLENPGVEDLYQFGTVAMILRVLRMPDAKVKVLVQAIARAKIVNPVDDEKMLMAKIEVIHESIISPDVHIEALIRNAREQSEKILNLRGIPTADIMGVLMSIDDPGRIADIIAANMRIKLAEAQKILECMDPVERLKVVNTHLAREVEVASMQIKIQSMTKDGMDKAQKDYYLREQLKSIRKELGEDHDFEEDLLDIRKALTDAGLPEDVQKEADKQLKRLSALNSDSAEAAVIRSYLDWLSELPWSKFSKDRLNISKAKAILDEDHFGLDKIKERLLEYLSVRKLNPESRGPILCLAGPPGVGKTSLGRSVARALGRKFQRISLGGMRDEAEIRGHRRTYIGSMPGRIIQVMKQAGTSNPVIVLDEIDKLGNDFRGDPSSALLEVLDPEQNSHFSDHYLNVEYDLSKVLFICTANHLENIPSALRDRLEVIYISGYTEQEKVVIANRYLVPKQIKENGLKNRDLVVKDTVLTKVIREYTREAGLRNLERELGTLCRKVARAKAEGAKGPFRLTVSQMQKYLGIPRYLEEEKDRELVAGVARGLAWTAAGGEVLHIEVSIMQGTGKLTLTGQLGDVMKESAQAALSYARTKSDILNIAPDFVEKHDIHIHVPAGATPKDGPSAGVTIVTALVSAIRAKAIRSDLCMTGEITLRGRVLPVGGIKEKILAAVAYGLKHVAIPKQNEKDLEDIPKDLRNKIQIHLINNIDQVLKLSGVID